MRGLLSLDQELRAARRAKGQNKSSRSSDSKETERPWQADIDQVNETMRELLRSIASLSGVELPGLPPGLEDNDTPAPRLDIKNLKDRLRNDLEGFSIKTTEELAKRAKEQTHAALDAVQNELGERIDEVADEFRKQLQLPGQVEKLLEPSVAEATERLEKSFSQKVEQLFADQERLVHDKLQEALTPVQAHVSAVEDAEARLERSLSEKVEQLFAKQECLVQEKLAKLPTTVQPPANTFKESESRLERSLSEKVQQLFAEQVRLTQERLEGALSSVQAQMSALEETMQQAHELKSDSVARSSGVVPNTAADDATKKNEIRINNESDRDVDQAFSRIKASFKNLLGASKTQPAQQGDAGLEGQANVFPLDDSDMDHRVQQALEHLGQLGNKKSPSCC